MQTGTFRLDGFILRSQIDLLLQERVFCDRHGRYLHQHPAGDVTEFEDRLAAAMARRLQSHPSGAGPLAELAAGGADLAAAGSGVGRSSGPAVLQSHPSPFDNQVPCAAAVGAAGHACMALLGCAEVRIMVTCICLNFPCMLAGGGGAHQPGPLHELGPHGGAPRHHCHPRVLDVHGPVPQVTVEPGEGWRGLVGL